MDFPLEQDQESGQVEARCVSYHMFKYSVSHNFIYPYIFAGNQANHQNFVPSLVPIDL